MTTLAEELPKEEDRPRERLLAHGPQTLSDAELVAILIRSGTRGKHVLQLARELVREGFAALKEKDPRVLAKLFGMGNAKAAQIAAMLELSNRIRREELEELREYDGDLLARQLVGSYSSKKQEQLNAAFLNARHRIVSHDEIFRGTIDHAVVSPREVIRLALERNAKAVVLYHNHPSGNPAPSPEDISFTERMKQSLRLCDIDLLDHLIIGAHRYCSLKAAGHV